MTGWVVISPPVLHREQAPQALEAQHQPVVQAQALRPKAQRQPVALEPATAPKVRRQPAAL